MEWFYPDPPQLVKSNESLNKITQMIAQIIERVEALPTITELYHREEFLEKIGRSLMATSIDGHYPLAQLNDARFKVAGEIIEVTCKMSHPLLLDRPFQFTFMRTIVRDGYRERLSYTDLSFTIPEGVSVAQREILTSVCAIITEHFVKYEYRSSTTW